MALRNLLFVFLFLFSLSYGGEKQIFIGAVKGSILPYIKEVASEIRVKDSFYMSYTLSAGSLHIYQKYKNYANFYVEAEKICMEELKKSAERACKKFTFYGLDHFSVSVTHLGDGNLLVVGTANIVCADIK
ncbi:hypothetical protein SAMN06265182_0183 [Persephonella hydrogeniphila]|uniref:Heavy-metal-binding n=2 Tax=Persephonella hydrogeniphila TaxID=198703 RepID=A0A285MZS9_9AQUI|nr:hypothetical protein SAMN06265182_0183 [Persephonella hydrogeniphila]